MEINYQQLADLMIGALELDLELRVAVNHYSGGSHQPERLSISAWVGDEGESFFTSTLSLADEPPEAVVIAWAVGSATTADEIVKRRT